MNNKRQELLTEIEKWQPKIQTDPTFLEIAFFKIFVKFENFITDIIIEYATKSVVNETKVPLRIIFEDREHFKNVTGLKYLDTSSKTIKLVESIFDRSNQISFFFDSEHASFFEEMKCLRNYIAHESIESKSKYIRKTLAQHPGDGFIEPNDFLSQKRRGEQDHIYTKFVNMVLTYSEAIDPDS